MNRIYCCLWSESRQTHVAVQETAVARGRPSRSRVMLAALGCLLLSMGAQAGEAAAPPPAGTLPTGAVVSAGQASLRPSDRRLDIVQSTSRAVIDWQSFSIGSAAQVNFVQPDAGSVVLNRVVGSDPSLLFGRLGANGQVFLVNPGGVLFGPTARVDVGGLVASSLSLDNADFLAGRYRFARGGAGVANQGELHAADGGYVALIAPEVRNEGRISARLGSVALASGDVVMLSTARGLSVAVDQGTATALIANRGVISAEGGKVLVEARAVGALQRAVVRNSGTIEARGISTAGGEIRLVADDVLHEGIADASSEAATGGQVVLAGDHVGVAGARIDARGAGGGGHILVGGDWQGGGGLPQATAVFIDQASVLDASATRDGTGGTVVAWSDVANAQSATRVHGWLLARGAGAAGEGGRIETSGHWVDVAGIRADAAAPSGRAGLWLLDPYNLTVSSSATTASTAAGPPYTFSSGSGATNVLNTDVNAQLNAGTSVTLQTTGTAGDGFGSGNISINAGISKTAGGDASLVLKAHNDITLAAGTTISSSSGKLHVTLNADSDGSGAGAIVLNSGSGITSNGGNITLGGGAGGTGAGQAVGSSSTNTAGILLNGATLSSGAGDIALRGTGYAGSANGNHGVSLSNGGTASTSGGNIAVNGIGGGSSTSASNYGVSLATAGVISAGGSGTVSVTGGGSAAPTGNSNHAVNVTDASSAITSAGGSVTVTGTAAGSGTSWMNSGVVVAGGGTITAGGSGAVAVTGTAGSGTGNNQYGVWVTGTNATITSGGGSVQVNGTGGADASGHARRGVAVETGGKITAGGAGTVTVQGQGGAGYNGDGVYVSGTGAIITSNSGAVTVTGTATSNASIGGTRGVIVSAAGVITAGGTGAVAVTGTASPNTQSSTNHGVLVTGASSAITSGGGNVQVSGTGATTTSGDNYGITVQSSGTISATGSGTLTLSGLGGTSSWATTNNYGVHLSGGTLSSASGAISLTGRSGNSDAGLYTTGGSNTISSTSGDITLTTDKIMLDATVSSSGALAVKPYTASTTIGIGSGAGTLSLPASYFSTNFANGFSGITIGSATGTGAINIAGGVSFQDALTIQSPTGAGSITLASTLNNAGSGTSSGSLTLKAGADISLSASAGITTQAQPVVLNTDTDGSGSGAIVLNSGSSITSNGGNITLGGGTAGTGAGQAVGSATNVRGVSLSSATLSSGAGNIVLRGTGYAGSANSNYGVYLGSSTASTSGGSITVDGTGGGSSASVGNHGVYLNAGALNAGSGGSVLVTGHGGTGTTGTSNDGVYLTGAGAAISAASGNVSITGVGGGSASSTSTEYGVYVETGAIVSAGGSGAISISGTGGAGTTSNNHGVYVFGTNASIQAADGSVSVTGQGGSGSGSSSNLGVYVASAGAIKATGSGSVTVAGTGGATSGGSSYGVYVSGSGSVIQTASGALSVTGTGGGISTAASNFGVYLGNSGSLTAGGSGSVTVDGTGAASSGSSNYGILLSNGSIGSSAGAISISGQSGAGHQGFVASFGTNTVSSTSGDIALQTDQVTLNGTTTFSSSGALTVRPRTAATTIGIGGAAGTLSLPASYFSTNFANGFSSVTIGSSSAGAITASAVTLNDATTLVSGAGITLNGAVSASGQALTLTGGNGATVSGNGDITASTLLLNGTGTTYTLDTASSNSVGTLAAAGVAGLGFINSGALTVGTVGSTSGVSASGTVSVATASGDLSLAQSAATTLATSSALTLNAGKSAAAGTTSGGNLLVSGGASVSVGAGGRATLYTGSVSGSTGLTSLVGSGSGRFRYASDESTTGYSTALGTGAHAIYREQPTVTATATSLSKTYDGAAFSGGNGVSYSGLLNGDSASDLGSPSYGGIAQGAVNVSGSPYTLTVSGLSSGLGYALAYGSGTLTINPYVVSLTGSRVYDATTGVSASSLTLGPLVSSQTLVLTGAGTLTSKDVGTGKTLSTGTLALGNGSNGGLAANYTLVGGTHAVDITPASLSVSGVSAVNRVYDATTAATLSGTASVSALGSDSVTVGGTPTASFANKNVGTGKAVTVSGYTLSGADASNYTLVQPSGLSADITPASLSVSGVSAENRIYDATTAATLSGTASVSALGSDSLTLGGTPTASFANKNVGTGKAVTVSGYTLSGADAGNYTLVQPSGLSADISPATLTIAPATWSKTYDGTPSLPAGATPLLQGVFVGDNVGLEGAARFDHPGAGIRNVQQGTLQAAGADAGNYRLAWADQPGVISPKPVTVTVSADSRPFDGTRNAVARVSVEGVLPGDAVGVSGAQALFADQEVGRAKAVTVSGFSLSGAGSANYRLLTDSAIAYADILRPDALPDLLLLNAFVSAGRVAWDELLVCATGGSCHLARAHRMPRPSAPHRCPSSCSCEPAGCELPGR